MSDDMATAWGSNPMLERKQTEASLDVDIVCEVEGGKPYVEMIRDGVTAALHHQNVQLPATVSVLVTDDAAVHALNKAFRDEDKPTDVLSFEDGERPFPTAPVHLGDIAIALPYASRQAERVGNDLAAELMLLAVHGTLHLLGHDHADEAEKAVMWKAQGEIIDSLTKIQRHEAPSMKPKHETELKARLFSFKYAFDGIIYVLRHEKNAWIHSIITIVIVGLAIWLPISRMEWAILLLTIMAIFIAEIMNTAVEALVDMTSPDFHPLAKVAKDTAAGAVLFGAIGAAMIGSLILGPPLWVRISHFL